ncbi:type II secretion system protein [Aestuariibacter salexigens]|uniref:type II secretion system protein n=1 Tax=Aestuariibacter salexigens TaxID=226010 RepID=UPI0003FB9397|nr:type II secretion system protein [Aestuariibacter salexigens]
MCRSRAVSGFTLVEILVVLVIIGLAASLAAPGLFQWIDARERTAIKRELQSKLMQLPMQAHFNNSEVRITSIQQLDMQNTGVSIVTPVRVLKNGYCLGGEVSIQQGAGTARLDVLPPFCELAEQLDS